MELVIMNINFLDYSFIYCGLGLVNQGKING
jgi:hypothetical protein